MSAQSSSPPPPPPPHAPPAGPQSPTATLEAAARRIIASDAQVFAKYRAAQRTRGTPGNPGAPGASGTPAAPVGAKKAVCGSDSCMHLSCLWAAAGDAARKNSKRRRT